MMLATAEVGTNLQTAIEAVGVAWAFAFAAFAFFKYGMKYWVDAPPLEAKGKESPKSVRN